MSRYVYENEDGHQTAIEVRYFPEYDMFCAIVERSVMEKVLERMGYTEVYD